MVQETMTRYRSWTLVWGLLLVASAVTTWIFSWHEYSLYFEVIPVEPTRGSHLLQGSLLAGAGMLMLLTAAAMLSHAAANLLYYRRVRHQV
ncbi:hypothetical protein SRABI76_01297 [Microbacterium oxydans]|nr:hypothetical protein SRABI76_01297 [Microbacterium oxydans]